MVDDFDEAERLLKDEVLAAMPEDEDAQALLGLCYTLARRQWRSRTVLAPLAAGEGRERSWPPGCLKNSGKNRRLA